MEEDSQSNIAKTISQDKILGGEVVMDMSRISEQIDSLSKTLDEVMGKDLEAAENCENAQNVINDSNKVLREQIAQELHEKVLSKLQDHAVKTKDEKFVQALGSVANYLKSVREGNDEVAEALFKDDVGAFAHLNKRLSSQNAHLKKIDEFQESWFKGIAEIQQKSATSIIGAIATGTTTLQEQQTENFKHYIDVVHKSNTDIHNSLMDAINNLFIKSMTRFDETIAQVNKAQNELSQRMGKMEKTMESLNKNVGDWLALNKWRQ